MIKKITTIFLLMLMVTTGFASLGITGHAEEAFNVDLFPYESMQVYMLPEYERPTDYDKNAPTLQLWYYATVKNNTGADYDGRIEINLLGEGKDFTYHSVSEINAEGTGAEVEHEDKGSVISIKPTQPIKQDATYQFAVMIMSKQIKADGSKKSFAEQFVAPGAIKSLVISILQPDKASDVVIQPEATKNDESGSTFYDLTYTDVEKDKAIDVNMSYTKKGNKTYMETVEAETKKDNSGNHTTIIIVLLIIAGVIIIGLVSIILLMIRQKNTPQDVNQKTKDYDRKYSTKLSSRKEVVVSTNAEIEEKRKKLRKQYVVGDIDEEKYTKEIEKLNEQEKS